MAERRNAPPVYAHLDRRERALRSAWHRLDPRLRTPNQLLGRRYPVGCVALENTQRCNLDCTICYLSDSSEKVKGVPLPVLFERIDRVAELYGPGVGVQVTGGDPTLRRRDVRGTALRFLGTVLRRPHWAVKGSAFIARKLWELRRGLVRSRGKVGRLTFFIQDFMSAHGLVGERIDNCSFMVMTDEGPVSMCEHNARREELILRPLLLPDESAVWQPLSGRLLPTLPEPGRLSAAGR